MNNVDAGDTVTPTDILDAGDGASPPTDIADSVFVLLTQPSTGAITPTFEPVDTAHGITPEPGLVLYVKIGGTATTVTMQVPGVQPYTGVPRDDVVLAGLSNTERAFYVPAFLAEIDEVAVVTYSQTVGVTSALLQVN